MVKTDDKNRHNTNVKHGLMRIHSGNVESTRKISNKSPQCSDRRSLKNDDINIYYQDHGRLEDNDK